MRPSMPGDQIPPQKFKGNDGDGDITVNRTDWGDANVVISSTRCSHETYPVIVALEPQEAIAFAHAVIDAARLIEGS